MRTSTPPDLFTVYEVGIERLLGHVGDVSPHTAELLVLQQRLLENIALTRQYGDTETLRHERARIIKHVNGLALAVQGPLLAVPNSPSRTTNTEQHNRHRMLQKVHNFWIKGVLENSLHGAALIELGMEYKSDAVQHPWNILIQRQDEPSHTMLPGTKIIDVFDQFSGDLLILGAPGSGKTTMLLELARALISRAEYDDTAPIPVIFNLSTFSRKLASLTDWLVEELHTKYYIPRKLAKVWVVTDKILLLLDGLDEAKIEYREACVHAINKYHQEHGLTPLVVCSRSGDYDALTTQLHLNGAVIVQPLTSDQINSYLLQGGTRLKPLHNKIAEDQILQELAQSPLMLSILTICFHDISDENLLSFKSKEETRNYIFNIYVAHMLRTRTSKFTYTKQQAIHWLSWLANKLRQDGQTIFLIEHMRPLWMLNTEQQQKYNLIVRIICGVIGGFVGWLSFWYVNPVYPIMGGFILSMIIVHPQVVIMAESLQWSWTRALKGLLIGCFLGVFSLLARGKDVAWFTAITVGIPAALIIGFDPNKIVINTIPNLAIRRSAQRIIVCVLLGGILGILTFSFIRQLIGTQLVDNVEIGMPEGLRLGCAIGAMVGLLPYGGLAYIQHTLIRLFLWRSGVMPWNYVGFLDYTAKLTFLQKVGGGWIFTHRSLMHFFANLEFPQPEQPSYTPLSTTKTPQPSTQPPHRGKRRSSRRRH